MNEHTAQSARDVVITGIGVVTPLGIGRAPFWESLVAGRSGVRPIAQFDAEGLPVRIAAEADDFDGKAFVRPRKNLKVMARDAQFAVASAELACDDARLTEGSVDPERIGVVFGADRIRNELAEIADTFRACVVDGRFRLNLWGTAGAAATYPLLMLKNLPNMVSAHISIARDARGPNNTICSGEASGLLAIGEAAAAIARGQVDVMLAGGAASRMHPLDWVRACLYEDLSRRNEEPGRACRPFDLERDGQVRGEGAGTLVLESRRHAERRGAPILARVLGWGAGFGQRGEALSRAATRALAQADLPAASLGHVSASGLGTRDDDRDEAQALAQFAPGVPVVAYKSYFGNLYSAGGAVELAASVLSLAAGVVPRTLNYETRDPECPIQVIRGEPYYSAAPLALVLGATRSAQGAAVVIGAP